MEVFRSNVNANHLKQMVAVHVCMLPHNVHGCDLVTPHVHEVYNSPIEVLNGLKLFAFKDAFQILGN